jgi:hypothetical protein
MQSSWRTELNHVLEKKLTIEGMFEGLYAAFRDAKDSGERQRIFDMITRLKLAEAKLDVAEGVARAHLTALTRSPEELRLARERAEADLRGAATEATPNPSLVATPVAARPVERAETAVAAATGTGEVALRDGMHRILSAVDGEWTAEVS